MGWTLGAFADLPNPADDEGAERSDLRPYALFTSADGTTRKHLAGREVRWGWRPSFVVGDDDFDDLLDAYEAAVEEEDGIAFLSWDTTDTASYTVIVYDWEEDPFTANDYVWHRVNFTLEAVEPGIEGS